MTYETKWESLTDAATRVMTTGGVSKEKAQSDLCQAIADGNIDLRCSLLRHGVMTSTARLDRTAFEIPDISPQDFDWDESRPIKPWTVRRGAFPLHGSWILRLIEVSKADVTWHLCGASHDQAALQVVGPAREAIMSCPAPAGQGIHFDRRAAPPGAFRKRSAAGSGRRRGPRPTKSEATKDAMKDHLRQGRMTVPELKSMLEKTLAERYRVSRDTARKAREAVLSEFGPQMNLRQIPTNDK